MKQERFPSLGPAGFHHVACTDWGDPASALMADEQIAAVRTFLLRP